MIYGKPEIVDICIVSGRSVAKARDDHYHNPPDYLVLEPGDTTARTRNLQQTNTNGYKWQSNDEAERKKAKQIVKKWGKEGKTYQPTPEYQAKLRELRSRFAYRLGTNFAKMDRIVHPEIEAFKTRVMNLSRNGMTINDWGRLLRLKDEGRLREALKEHLNIIEVDAESILE